MPTADRTSREVQRSCHLAKRIFLFDVPSALASASAHAVISKKDSSWQEKRFELVEIRTDNPAIFSQFGLSFYLLLVKGLDIFIYRRLQGNQNSTTAAVYNAKWHTDRQWHRWRSASSGYPLPEWTDFGPRRLHYSYNRPTVPMSQPAALWPSPRNVLRQRLAIFSSEYYQIQIDPAA